MMVFESLEEVSSMNIVHASLSFAIKKNMISLLNVYSSGYEMIKQYKEMRDTARWQNHKKWGMIRKCETLTLIKYVCVLIICLCELKHDIYFCS